MAIYLKRRRTVIEEWKRFTGTDEIVRKLNDLQITPPDTAENICQHSEHDERAVLPSAEALSFDTNDGESD